jgi:DNA-binding LytR/AlgR family response regulator
MVQCFITNKAGIMMNCIAVDDEPLALKLLQDNISKLPYLNLVASCTDAFQALSTLQEHSIDLIFIDIQMPGLSGLQLISSLEIKPLVIFITAYKQHALESYDLAVVDYLVKPVSVERFIKACNRAKEIFDLKAMATQKKNAATKDFMFVNMDYSQVKIKFDDIILIESLRDYVKIHQKTSKLPLIVRSSLTSIESELPPDKFIRIHKSYILSIENITAVRKNSIFIKDLEFPIGETYRGSVDKLMRKTL